MSHQDLTRPVNQEPLTIEQLWELSGRTPNAGQQRAIKSIDGPLLIIAGPGSGKTFTLVERIVYLITEKSAQPENLFVVTFTNKAAHELTTRISNRLLAIGVRFNLNDMYLGTFHSICLRWLEEFREFTRLKRNFIMLDQFDQQYFLYQNLDQFLTIPGIEHVVGQPKQSAWYKSENLLKWVNKVSEEALDADTLIAAPDEAVRVLGQCHALYHQQLEEANALDFSTIQYEALKLLRAYPDVLRTLQDRIDYLMVDEYQDTNTIQELILTRLAGDQPKLCVVGDDDQGLYRFRGATIRNILQFEDNFPDGACDQVELDINYRSHPDIIHFYRHWIEDQTWTHDGATFRYPKQVHTPEDGVFPDLPTVLKVTAETQDRFHHEVLALLYTLRDQGHLTDWNQVAFLFRSVKNHKAVALSRFLERNGIPVYSPRSNQFFEREEIRLMIGALIFLFPQFEKVREHRIRTPLEIWGYYDDQCFRFFAEQLRKPENRDLLAWARSLAMKHLHLTENTDYAFSGLFYQLLNFPMFSRYLDEDLLKGTLLDSRAMHNLALFSQLLTKCEYLHHMTVFTPQYLDQNLRQLFNQFIRYLMDGGIDEYEDEAEYAPSGSVSFLTIHQSKGLEFPVVVVGSLEAYPRRDYTHLDEILESSYLTRPPFEPLAQTKFYDFRRLFYTAFSRAQNLLVLACHEKQGRGRTPSKYFADYVATLPSWRDSAFQPRDLPLTQIKDVELKNEYSFTSHITLFENCAEQYRFFRELEFAPVRTSPILFGALVHQTIEDIHKTVLRGEEHKLSEARVRSWFDTNYVYLTKRERVYLAQYIKDVALDNVLRYYRRHQDDWSHILEAEVDVSLVKDDYILKGTIDLIAGDHDTVEVVDFKSEKKPDVNHVDDCEKLNRYRRQLEVYAHLVEQRTAQHVAKTHLYYTSAESASPYITFDKDTHSIDRTIHSFDHIVGRIEHKDFTIAARPDKLCIDCDMRFYCDAKNWHFRSSR